MKKRISFLLFALLAAGALTAGAAAYNTGDDYPQNYKNPDLDTVVDEWNFYNRECTSFVAWCLNSRNGIPFTNQYGGVGRWGNAYEWAAAAEQLGYAVDMNPAVGSVFWQDRIGNTGTGHVAWVKAVNGDGTVMIEQYNSTYVYSTGERLPAGCWSEDTCSVTDASGYIHIGDIGSSSPSNPTVSAPSVAVSGQTVTISWPAVEGARQYNIWIQSTATSLSRYLSTGLMATSFTTTLEGGYYRVKIEANFTASKTVSSDAVEFRVYSYQELCGDKMQ